MAFTCRFKGFDSAYCELYSVLYRIYIVKTFLILLLIPLLTTSSLLAYDSMYEKTPVGKIKVLKLPARLALEANSDYSYFDADNGLFRKLFRFISSNDVSMTTPVEADIKPGKMRFFVGKKDMNKNLQSSNSVKVTSMPARMVVSIGIRGGYSEKSFNSNQSKLIEWFAKNKKYEQDGPAYGVYWNGPFVPGFFKRSEVHIPIRTRKKDSQKKIK